MDDLDLTAIAEERRPIRSTYLRRRGRPTIVLGPRAAPRRAPVLGRRLDGSVLLGGARVPSHRDLRELGLCGVEPLSSTSGTETSRRSSTCLARPRPHAEVLGGLHQLAISWTRSAGSGSSDDSRRPAWRTRRKLEPRSTPRPRWSTPRAHRRPARGDVRHRRPLTVRRRPVRARQSKRCCNHVRPCRSWPSGVGSRRAARRSP